MSESSVLELAGTPGSPGQAAGPARVVHGPDGATVTGDGGAGRVTG